MRFAVRRLRGADALIYRDIRLEGLRTEPMAFGATLEEDSALPEERWRTWLENGFCFGVFTGDELTGVASYYVETGAKTDHRGHLVAVYLRPHARGTGAARMLVEAVVESARQKVAFLYLQVGQANARAVRFYERLGFVVYGKDPGGLRVADTIYEDYLMMLRLDKGSTESDT